jgi:hypothetical protein
VVVAETEAVSSFATSCPGDSSVYVDVHGEVAAESPGGARVAPCALRRGGRLEAGKDPAAKYEDVSRSGPEPTEAAEKEKAGSSSASHEGRAVSGDGESVVGSSWFKGRVSFLFFEEDVLKASCLGSSGSVVRLGVDDDGRGKSVGEGGSATRRSSHQPGVSLIRTKRAPGE